MYVREKAALGRESEERRKAQIESARNAQTAKFLNDMIAGINPDEAKGADPALIKKILSAAAGRVGADLKGQPKVECFLRNTIGSTCFAMGLYVEAKAQFEEGLKIANECLGPENRLTLKFRSNHASVMDAEGSSLKAKRRTVRFSPFACGFSAGKIPSWRR
jgi:non-specific serine/threonine protein kinase/serine/threonine-protein kinase